MKKKKSARQILAVIGVILLVILYLSTLVFALMGSEWSHRMLSVSLFCSIFIPILIYVFILLSKKKGD